MREMAINIMATSTTELTSVQKLVLIKNLSRSRSAQLVNLNLSGNSYIVSLPSLKFISSLRIITMDKCVRLTDVGDLSQNNNLKVLSACECAITKVGQLPAGLNFLRVADNVITFVDESLFEVSERTKLCAKTLPFTNLLNYFCSLTALNLRLKCARRSPRTLSPISPLGATCWTSRNC